MSIEIYVAADLLEVDTGTIYSDPKYRKFIVKSRRFDINNYFKCQEEKEKENDFKMDMLNFMDFLIAILGRKQFFANFDHSETAYLMKAVRASKISLNKANLIKNTFYDKYYKKYRDQNYSREYVPLEKRKPLTKDEVMKFWQRKRTYKQVAESLNVPLSWVISQVNRLGLEKRKNKIKCKGRKGYKTPESVRLTKSTAPLAKEIVQICPESFEIIKEYPSIGSVVFNGFKCRENIRDGIKTASKRYGFFWAEKGKAEGTIRVIKKRQKIG